MILFNTAVAEEEYTGIPVLKHGKTVRYLGHAVGTGDRQKVDWATRIRNVQRRLATAAQLATSVEKVKILNVIMLPSILFTAAVFDMPAWAEAQILNIQKQFLWQHSTSTEATRHRTPKRAGGVGLASVPVACLTQNVKQTMCWLIQRHDNYYDA